MRVIGTAGHVDHGKSTLVQALTGIDPDRLAEEKARQMTIDLGFAWLTLPGGEQVGVVDVPGHRDFIENMLAGVGGIDAVILVIAADEGVMPQTSEHLAILDLLDVRAGLVALTKIDLIDDPDWLELVESQIRETLERTTLADAPILRVSARAGDGLPELVVQLETLLSALPPHVDMRAPRLSIDRVFTMSGFGTVVTGTLLGGSLRVGDDVEIQPTGLRGRVRGLQSYHQPVDVARPSSRVAVNLSGVERSAIERGDVLAKPGMMQPTTLIDVRFRHVPAAHRALKHNAEVKLFVGAAETTARVRLLGDEELAPGADGWLQLRLSKPIAAARGDRFILRYPSPAETIGGGVVVEPHPARRWRRFQPSVIAQLETRLNGTPAERLAQAASEPMKRHVLRQRTGYSQDEFETVLNDAITSGVLIALPDDTVIARAAWVTLNERMRQVLSAFHHDEPLRLGMPREALRSQLGLKLSTFAHLLDNNTDVVVEGNLVRAATHQVTFDARQSAAIGALRQRFAASPYAPPSYNEATAVVGENVLRALVDLGDVVQVSADVLFWRDAYAQMVAVAMEMVEADGVLVTTKFRDHFGTSRKYAIALLEHLDAIGLTRREGDNRVRR